MQYISRLIVFLLVNCIISHAVLPCYPIQDATHLSSGVVGNTFTPGTRKELQGYIQSAYHNGPRPISIAGAQYSQGGQVWCHNGTVIDMSRLNRILDVDVHNKTITVESGVTWRQIQEMLNPMGLSPCVMQSYNDFTVGGALSVNAHGRDTVGSVIKTVKSMQVLLPDGTIKTASRDCNYDLFRAVIGGYGACGIITQVTLEVTDNVAIRREAESMTLSEYIDYLHNYIIDNDHVVLHNANIYPKAFNELLAITWVRDDEHDTVRSTDIMRPDSKYLVDTFGELIVRRFWGGKYLREKVEQALTSGPGRTHRNYEIGRPVASLGPWTQFISSNILQEYFIPLSYLKSFLNKLRDIRNAYSVNILNASIRYVSADNESILSYAPYDCCSVVLYINLVRTPWAFENAQRWTQELIDAARICHGTYYLPYHLFATREQFQAAYPGWKQLQDMKSIYDPGNILHNTLIDTYFS